MTTTNISISYKRKAHHTDELLLELYKSLLLPRMIEERMLNQLRMNKISKWFSGIGQEAISVGVAKALQRDEFMLPMHRNLGVFTSRHVPLLRLFQQWQGKLNGYTQGRDRSFHFGSVEDRIVGMISHLGPQLAVGSGIALGDKLMDNGAVTVAFTGEGGTSEGDFHEALNVASVWKLPIIFVIENNGYGLSTPVSEQYNCDALALRGLGYGMEAVRIDGNNILEVYDAISKLSQSIRENPHPVLIEAMTFRMRGHEEASGVKYVPKELMEAWSKKDPIHNFEQFLIAEGILTNELIELIRAGYKEEISENLKNAYALPPVAADLQKETSEIYAPYTYQSLLPKTNTKSPKKYIDAIKDGLYQSMQRHDNLVLMGQDIAEYGGVFKITDGFVDEFGRERVRNTPLCESAILGIGLGLSIKQHKTMVEMQFSDFVSCGFNQIVNNISKLHYRWGQNVDMVIRMPSGGNVGAGPFHSQTVEGWFTHCPGLKIVYPSNPYDAKGLLIAAFEDPNPVMYFEHKALYRDPALEQAIPDAPYTVEIGKANIVQAGTDMSIITYGLGVHWAMKAAQEFPHISFEIIDLRSLVPLDTHTIFESVQKTNKVIVLHEASLTGGFGGELAALIAEHCFEYLDGPIKRCGALDTPVPFAKALEAQYMPIVRFKEAIEDLYLY